MSGREANVEALNNPLANVITLGVRDLAAQRDFYRRLGWQPSVETSDYAAFALRGTVLALFPIEKLAADSGAAADPPRGGIRFSIGVLVQSPAEVDALIERVRAAGGRITKEPVAAEHFEGRSAYFADPEGNHWEVAWAPADNKVVAAAARAAGLAA
jgi:catechol 2,3-dioxygenase-like lactoylglutathione lyase family enzyme